MNRMKYRLLICFISLIRIGWTVAEYVHWFNEHSDTERYQFLHNLLNSYKQSVIAQGITEFAHNFPLMIQIIESS